MIILSQDKKTTVNFDNAYSIWIDIPSENDNGMYSIETAGEINETLGYYKTEKRALEVKAEIERAYINCKLAKIPKMGFYENITSTQLSKYIRFEMPEI